MGNAGGWGGGEALSLPNSEELHEELKSGIKLKNLKYLVLVLEFCSASSSFVKIYYPKK